MKDYSKVEILTKSIYTAQHKNYSIDPSIFERHLSAAQDLKTYDLSQSFFQGISVLDAGCGNTGYFQIAMKNLGVKKVTCLDIGSEWIPELKKVLETHCCGPDFAEYVPGSATDLPFPDDTFDLVCSNGVIMHLETVELAETALIELARVVKPGGYVYSHIGIDRPGIVDRYIVPALRKAYKEDSEFKVFIDSLDPCEIVAELSGILKQATVYDRRMEALLSELQKLITLDTTTFWQNML